MAESKILLSRIPNDLLLKIFSNFTLAEFHKFFLGLTEPAREMFNDLLYIKAVLFHSLRQEVEAFEWDEFPTMTSEEMSTNHYYFELKSRYIMSRLMCISHRKNYSDYPNSDSNLKKVMACITELGCSRQYSAVVLSIRKDVSRAVDELLAERKPLPVLSYGWDYYLLHLQQFSECVRYFRDVNPCSPKNLEKAFFELSRCQLEFSSLATHRLHKLMGVRKDIATMNSDYSGKVKFPSLALFYGYLEGIIAMVLKALKPKEANGLVDGNILRYYEGKSEAPQVLCLSVIAKLLQEECFDKLTFLTPNSSFNNVTVKVTTQFLLIGDMCISVSQGDCSVSINSRAQMQATAGASMLKPLMVMDVVEAAFSANSDVSSLKINTPSDLNQLNWSLETLGTSRERLRFLRTIIKSVCNRDGLPLFSFRPLLQNNDCFIYYACACKIVEVEHPDFSCDFTSFSLHGDSSENNEIIETTVVLNTTNLYVGIQIGGLNKVSAVVTSSEQLNSFYRVLPSDDVEASLAKEGSLVPLKPQVLATALNPFLKWFAFSEGMNYASRYFFTHLTVEGDRIKFYYDKVSSVLVKELGF